MTGEGLIMLRTTELRMNTGNRRILRVDGHAYEDGHNMGNFVHFEQAELTPDE